MMFTDKNILAIGAHPDDIEYAIFGTLMKARPKCRLYCYIATVGGQNDKTSSRQRMDESNKALDLLEPIKIHWTTNVGLKVTDYPYLVSLIEEIIAKYKINLVLTHTKHDTHQDHRLLSQATVTAMRRSNASLLFYDALSRDMNFNPDLFVDITEFFELKKELLTKHESQKEKFYMSEEFIEKWNSNPYPYLHAHMRYSESFEIGRMFF